MYKVLSPIKYGGRVYRGGVVELPERIGAQLVQSGHVEMTAQPTPESSAPATAGAASALTEAGAGGSSGQDSEAPIDPVRAVEPDTQQAQSQPPAPGDPGAAGAELRMPKAPSKSKKVK